MRASRLGLRRLDGHRFNSPTALVLCHGALLQPIVHVEFALGEATEHFLAAHQNALEFFGRVPAKIIIDNPKTAVLKHPAGERPLFHPRYLDFAAHYGFEPRACNVRRPNEKGRVESGVGYVKKNFLDGLQLPPGLNALNTAARHWMDTVANVRIHGETHKQPIELFALEKPHLNALPPLPADTGVTRTVPTSSRFRVVLDTNRYSVPSLYASQRLLLKTFADRLCIYHGEKLIATHTRSYDRHEAAEAPDHAQALLDQRRAARDAKLLLRFYGLCPRAEEYYLQLKVHRLNPRQHITKIMALSEVHGCDKIARAIEDSFEFQAFSSDYIANILQQRERFSPQPGPLHLTRRQDLLEVELEQPDLSGLRRLRYHPHCAQTMTRNPADLLLNEHLDYLKLTSVKENCQPLAVESAANHWSHLDYLGRLLQGEVAARQQRTIARRIK